MEKVHLYENKEKQIITLSIQEIVNDFHRLGIEEGFLSGVFNDGSYDASYVEEYYDTMLQMTKKYIPTYEKHVNEVFFDKETELHEKGLMLNELLEKNFKEIFYKLV